MNKNKIVSMLLCTSIILGSSTFALAGSLKGETPVAISIESGKANIKISKEKAKTIAKDAIKKYFGTEINEDFKCNITQDSYERYGKAKAYWNVNWNLNTYDSNIYLHASINAEDGTIKSISMNDQNAEGKSKIPTITFDEAKEISGKFANKINSKKIKESKLDNDNWSKSTQYSNSYEFTYSRIVNGIKFEDNNIKITVDGVSGKVVNYNFTWDDDLQFPSSTNNVISKTKANNIFKNDLTSQIVYERFRNKYQYQDNENKKNVKLVFDNSFEKGTIINGAGKYLNEDNKDNVKTETVQLNENEQKEFYKKAKTISKRSKPLEKSEVKVIMENIIIGMFGKGYIIEEYQYNDNEFQEKSSWRAYFKKEGKDKKVVESGSISIDALTGQIISIYKDYDDYRYEEKFKPAMNWKEGYYEAITALAEYLPDKIKNIELKQNHEINIDIEKDDIPERRYNYSFTRIENDIPYNNNNIRVQIDAKTGDICNINVNWEEDVVFQSPKGNIGKDKTKEILFGKYSSDFGYKIMNLSKDKNKPQWKVELVYQLKGAKPYYSFNNIDAFTGDFLNYDGEEINDNIEDFKKEIKGSKAEKELSILAYNGIIDTKDFVLKKDVQKMDLIKVLVDALGYRPYVVEEKSSFRADNLNEAKEDSSENAGEKKLSKEDYLKMAKYYGFFDGDTKNFNEKEAVTREEMAKAFIKFLNYDNIAECKGIFAVDYKDSKKINKDLIGYVALADGLGLIQVNNKLVRAKNTASNEELYLGLYNVLLNNKESSLGIYR